MDVMLHKRCAKFVYVLPEGLRELMSDISREVIRSNPENIYTFIADYLDALMITRENARVAARLVESILRIGVTTVELLEKTGLTREEADRMATIIQCAFKQYMASRKGTLTIGRDKMTDSEDEQEMVTNVLHQYGEYIAEEEQAAIIIQKAFRAFKEKHERENKLLSGMIDWRVAARSAIYLYRKTGVTHEEANRAATLIKAAYKGYYTRRVMKRLMEEGQMLYEEDESRLEEEEQEMLEIEEEIDLDSMDQVEERHWKDFVAPLEAEVPGDIEAASSVSDITSTDIASTLIDSILKVIPDDQAGSREFVEGMPMQNPFSEGTDTGTEYVAIDVQGTEATDEITLESGSATFAQTHSQEITLPVEGHSDDKEKPVFEEGIGNYEIAVDTENEGDEEISGYSEHVTDT